MRVRVLTFQGRARGSQESGQGVCALFCLCDPQPCQIGESRTLQTPPTWASSHHGWLSRTLLTTAEAGFPTVHLEKTLDLRIKASLGPRTDPPSPGKEAEGERGSGRSEWEWGRGPRGQPRRCPAGLARHWAGPKGQTRGGTWGRGTGLSSGPRSAASACVKMPKGSGHVARAQPAATVTSPCQELRDGAGARSRQ